MYSNVASTLIGRIWAGGLGIEVTFRDDDFQAQWDQLL